MNENIPKGINVGSSMDESPWILFDCDYLAHRAYYSMPRLEFEGMGTSVTFGFLSEVIRQQNLHASGKVAFCFDKGKSLRKEIYGGYKDHSQLDEFEWKKKKELHKQIHFLRDEYLIEIGYKNVFCQDGYEADDMIASICENLRPDERAVIVSADADLLQLLREDQIEIWNLSKKKMITESAFYEEWGIEPSMWSEVKAIAGCVSDKVKGVKGVGEKKAAAFLRNEIKPGSIAGQNIVNGSSTIERNRKLVRLPFKGTRHIVDLQEDKISRGQWLQSTKRLNMHFEMGVW